MAGFVAVHTGAGNCVNETKYKKICKESCEVAISVLKSGETALGACEAAIVALENCGYTNAGYGSNLTWDGRIECEASIMDGTTRHFGACTNLSKVKNPIRLARILCERQSKLLSMDRIPPMILSGEGAVNYAKDVNLPIVNEEDMVSNKARKTYEHYQRNIEQYENTFNVKVTPLDTVGAVVVDAFGNCAAGCSSGGLILKLSGRIGQAACYGAGCWASKDKNKSYATCTTGNGEYLMRTLLAREIVSNLKNDQFSIQSLYNTFKNDFLESPFLKHLDEIYGGALTLVYDSDSGDGELLWSHTTQSFCIGHMSTKQKSPRFVFSTLPDNKKQGKSIAVQSQPFKVPI
ncbi:threonine aspartase 1 [Contarinia nasturtii]|uniref:threonine aspartase 1 n=1 Tax=Contarinia nasturtii TaxID=265458 RepID=UPI0012D39FB2|nr:threonine aspartase 1 [Contarinia nasturtii]